MADLPAPCDPSLGALEDGKVSFRTCLTVKTDGSSLQTADPYVLAERFRPFIACTRIFGCVIISFDPVSQNPSSAGANGHHYRLTGGIFPFGMGKCVAF
jgi:hypothetical protein